MMKKNGFISISVIYSFFIVFLLIMALMMATYVNNRYLFNIYKKDIKQSVAGSTDIARGYKKVSDKVTTEGIYENGAHRYQGVNPNNYVNLNGERWRIIGYFSGTGTKIVKEIPIGPENFNVISGSILTNYYSNLDSSIKNLVVTNKTELFNRNDYMYAVKGTDCSDRVTSPEACRAYNWLGITKDQKGYTDYEKDDAEWLSEQYNSSNQYIVSYTGVITYKSKTSQYMYRPVLYIKDSIKISGGSGTYLEPYNLVAG